MRKAMDSIGALMGGERITGLFEMMLPKLTSSRIDAYRLLNWEREIEDVYDLPDYFLYNNPLVQEALQLATGIISIIARRHSVIYLASLHEPNDEESYDPPRQHIAGLIYANELGADMNDRSYDIREITDSAVAVGTLHDAGLDTLVTDIVSVVSSDHRFTRTGKPSHPYGRVCDCNGLRWSLLMRQKIADDER